ncbi:hypothetical protein VARIO8X_20400 [Burkholderiales bacterium 8X]|nr:hypothetical protein VARIO8X_20400 [Burkholderiales bacterium 8X]
MATEEWVDRFKDLKEADESRPDFPGEHLVVLGVGVLLLVASGRSRSLIARTLMGAAAAAFIGRAASGTGGIAKLASLLDTRGRRW